MITRLAIHSYYSLLWGTSSVNAIVDYLAQEGCKAVGITDKDNLYGLFSIREAAKEANIAVIIGSELTTKLGPIFVFVASLKGYRRLTTLLSTIKTKENFDVVEALKQDTEGLIVITKEPILLKELANFVSQLYAGVSPKDFKSISVARKLNLKLAAIDDASFLTKEEFETHQVLRAIATSKTVGMLTPTDLEDREALILPTAQYLKEFSSWPQALKQTELIGKQCSNLPLFTSLIFPTYPTKDKKPKELLYSRVLKGAEKRYGELNDAIIERIDYELNIIAKKNFCTYFLVIDDIVALASRTCGRGSAASSIVAYALGITNVDPIKHNLYFERFLNEERTDAPDVDVDFAWDERDAILQQVIEKFGFNHCARVANHNRFKIKGAFRESAKAFGFSDAQIASFQRESQDPLWEKVTQLASTLINIPHTISMHCGGIVITPKAVSEYAPIEYSLEKYPLLAWEKEGTEESGLVKIDLLGNRSLAVIRDALANLNFDGIFIDENTWQPTEDLETQKALAKGDSLGVFYIESPAMRLLQKKTNRGDFEHIVIHSSIIRPAANEFINEYIRRLKGGKWNTLHPILESVLEETYGILCYQEDVSKIGVALAGFNEAQADTLRKVIAKKKGTKRLSHYKELFKQGCLKNGLSLETIEQIWQMINSFEGYSFCKAHSASYAMVSFQAAYLRVHHKAYFMAAVLSNEGGYYHPLAYVSEIRRMNLSLYGPDINISKRKYWAQKEGVIVGFMAIANLSSATIEAIEKERQLNGPFKSLREFSKRLYLQQTDLIALVSSGSFDSISQNKSRSEQLKILLISRQNKNPTGQIELFTQNVEFSRQPQQIKKEFNQSELQSEFESLGFLRNAHPLILWAKYIVNTKRIKASEIEKHINRFVTLIGWPITRKNVLTKKGEAMAFVSFEDESDLYETVLFPTIFERYNALLTRQIPLVITGFVKNDYGAFIVEIDSLKYLGKN